MALTVFTSRHQRPLQPEPLMCGQVFRSNAQEMKTAMQSNASGGQGGGGGYGGGMGGGMRGGGGVHPTPFTLYPAPYTLFPAPYTLHPTP